MTQIQTRLVESEDELYDLLVLDTPRYQTIIWSKGNNKYYILKNVETCYLPILNLQGQPVPIEINLFDRKAHTNPTAFKYWVDNILELEPIEYNDIVLLNVPKPI